MIWAVRMASCSSSPTEWADTRRASWPARSRYDTVRQYVLHTMDWFFRLGWQQEEDLLTELRWRHPKVPRADLVRRGRRQPFPPRNGHDADHGLRHLAPIVRGARRRQPLLCASRQAARANYHRSHDGPKIRRRRRPHRGTSRKVPLEPRALEIARRGRRRAAPDVYKGQLTTGDTLLLCSDGLTKHVSHDELLSTLLGSKNAEESCQQLVAMANSAGGTDNVTIVIAKFIADVRGDSLPSSGE